MTLADLERRAIQDRLEAKDYHLGNTADSLGISRTTLWRRIRSYGLADVVRHKGWRRA